MFLLFFERMYVYLRIYVEKVIYVRREIIFLLFVFRFLIIRIILGLKS